MRAMLIAALAIAAIAVGASLALDRLDFSIQDRTAADSVRL